MVARTPPRWHRILWGAALLLLPASTPVSASSAPERGQPAGTRLSQSRVLPYPVDHVWGASIRYLRVDRDYAIVDRDEETGYIVFEIPLGGEVKGRGALEAFSTKDASGRVSTQLQISTEAGPTHLPHTLLEGIAKKVRSERGQAPTAPKPPAKPPAEDDDDDGRPPSMPAPVNPGELPLQ